MTNRKIYLGQMLKHNETAAIGGEYVTIDSEAFYKISNYDHMDPFFISVVSDSDHWLYISSQGGLSAGRINSENALFPYYTDDKVTDGSSFTGSRTIALVTVAEKTSLWEPFSENLAGIYNITRNIYKNVCGDKLIFEEINNDLGVAFQYVWKTSDKFGFVKTSQLTNTGEAMVSVEILDGIENLLPYGVEQGAQNTVSCLVDAYKKNELQADVGLGIYSMSSILVDRAEPSEALSATTVWSVGLNQAKKLVSSIQLDNFRNGLGIDQESDVRGRRGAYFVNAEIALASGEIKEWHMVAEINQGPAKVKNLIAYIKADKNIVDDINNDIAQGSENLARIVGNADGLQVSEDVLSANHHFANVLFNVMRGGLFDDNYTVGKADLIAFVQSFNSQIYTQCESFFNGLSDHFHYSDFIKAAAAQGNANLERLCYEYLPLTFSRRHGDPSRPWNKFSIDLKNDDGSKLLNFQGNWRDIFQNWEALSFSIPNFIESMICKFVNATTADGYNPYRITKQGIDWERLDADDPWSNIGYWGDHQIIYLLKFLEFSNSHHPGTLQEFLTKNIFGYANVPYSLKSYEELLEDPRNTIDYDDHRDEIIDARVNEVGADGRMIWRHDGSVLHVNLTEKLLATVLSKLSNFIPEGGIWMNTQRPEWNDANNALVGFGVSMVTLYYTRRYQQYLFDLFSAIDLDEVMLTQEMYDQLDSINTTFEDHQGLLTGKISDTDRKNVMDRLGKAGADFRANIYKNGFSGKIVAVKTADLLRFFELSLQYIDHTIRANRRDDGLYHAYNLMDSSSDGVEIKYLYEMLEGQVSVLSSGYLSPKQAIEVLGALRNSAIYTARQHSYLLYPDRELARFVDKNIVPKSQAEASELIQALVAEGDTSLVELDEQGDYHFNGTFNNVDSAKSVLAKLAKSGHADLVAKDAPLIEKIFEGIFNHIAFTGRSGGMYAYEGLGSIYWHMVSKLLLATLENYQNALEQGEDAATVGKLVDIYYDIRAGIGFNKTPEEYGAFPTDPYSHTPGFAGAKQPGMTGQVKEEVITRQIELGVVVIAGSITFNPIILRKSEFLLADAELVYFDVQGNKQCVALAKNQLGFTYCQVPVVYSLAKEASIVVTMTDGTSRAISGNVIDADTSMLIFDKKHVVAKIAVALEPLLD